MHSITADRLLPLLDEPGSLYLLDVREPDEFAAWRIPGSVNVPLGTLGDHIAEVPRDREVVTVCAAGTRATRAAELLSGSGIDAGVLAGGMDGWAETYDSASIDLGGATVVQVRRRGKGCLSYIIGTQGAAVVIDPSADIEQYTKLAQDRGWAITHIFDTHLHADHVSGARALAAATGAEVVLNPADPFRFAYTPLADGMRIALSDEVALTVSVMSTPGHTEGSTSFLLGDSAIFSGDILFLESVGRPDLADQAEEFAHALYRTLHDKVLELPGDAVVFPAHYGDAVEVHAGTVVGERLDALRAGLRMLSMDEDEFVAWASSSVPDRPPNYVEIVKANQGSTSLSAEERRTLEVGPNRCAISAH
jgi:glyoxylase-like metal-dependent hydrolase (beta-lactamase superfamily II)